MTGGIEKRSMRTAIFKNVFSYIISYIIHNNPTGIYSFVQEHLEKFQTVSRTALNKTYVLFHGLTLHMVTFWLFKTQKWK